MCYIIKQPENKNEISRYYHLRWQLLRAPWAQPEGSEVDDIEDQCFHIMALDDDEVIAVARLQFNTADEAQIRYMAVADEYRKKNIGRRLISELEQHALKSACKKIVLDAREPAVNFYLKQGYRLLEKSYLLFDEIQHFKMEKKLSV